MAAPPIAHEVLSAPGQPPDASTRAFMEPRFGHDFSQVRIHTDEKAAESAKAVGALAYTLGRDVVFGEGQYAPKTTQGQQLLAHELSHTLQQNTGAHGMEGELKIASAENAAESEAGRASKAIMQRQPAAPLSQAGERRSLQRAKPESPSTKKKERPIGEVIGVEDTVRIEGEPTKHLNYIQNVIQGVGIAGWGGPFRLDRKIVNGVGVDSIYLPRNEVHLDKDPLKETSGELGQVYKSRAAANKALAELGVRDPAMYTYYIGPGGHIYPTIISDTTAPLLCVALRKVIETERIDAKAVEKGFIGLLFWYAGARFPVKAGGPPKGGAPKQGTSVTKAAVSGGAAAGKAASKEGALVFVEIGAGDLKASIELAKKGGVKVIAVDPAAPAAEAIKELETVGGSFVKGTAGNLSSGIADHVFQYLPYRIGGSGSFVGGGTWRLISDTVRLLKPGGAAHFVTEDLATAQFLAKEAASRGLRTVLTETVAGAAAPGASGAGVPGFSGASKVWLVNIYK